MLLTDARFFHICDYFHQGIKDRVQGLRTMKR
jgi:hypothetical protein